MILLDRHDHEVGFATKIGSKASDTLLPPRNGVLRFLTLEVSRFV